MSEQLEPVEVVEKGVSLSGSPGVYRYLTTEEEEKRTDLVIENVSFQGLLNFVTARKEEIIAAKSESHLRINTRTASATLDINEQGGYRHGDAAYKPSLTLEAKSSFSKRYNKAKALMTTHSSPHDLFEKLREVPFLFNDAQEHTKVLQAFRSLVISVKKLVEDTSSDSGERKKRLEMSFNEQPPEISWKWLVPVYENTDPIAIPVSVLFEANSAMNGVNIRLVNWGLEEIEDKEAKAILETSVANIESVLGVNTIPMLYVN